MSSGLEEVVPAFVFCGTGSFGVVSGGGVNVSMSLALAVGAGTVLVASLAMILRQSKPCPNSLR